MSTVEEMKMHIKVFINKQKSKVLFAEAGSDFTDILFSFLLLPLGTILKLLNEEDKAAPVIGSLNTLYRGVVRLDSFHFHTEAAKQKLLDPKVSSCYKNEWQKLRHNFTDSQPPTSSNSAEKYDGVFTESEASFIISDDMQVMPNMPHSFLGTLRNLGIDVADMDGAEMRVVAFGVKEIDALLRILLVSRNPLTALVFPGREMGSTSVISRQGNALSGCINQKVVSMNPKKMILKAMMQKSSKKLMYAQADYDFISFIFGMLTIPLAKVEWLLGGNTGLKNMDHLRMSIVDRSNNMHLNLKPAGLNMLLINPILPCGSNYLSTTNVFSQLNFAPCENQCHVKGVRMYMVSDDLTVAPLTMSSCLSVLDKQKISVSDVEEVELRIGLEEGLSILKAALTSTTALTDGLIKHMRKGSVTSDSAFIKYYLEQLQLLMLALWKRH